MKILKEIVDHISGGVDKRKNKQSNSCLDLLKISVILNIRIIIDFQYLQIVFNTLIKDNCCLKIQKLPLLYKKFDQKLKRNVVGCIVRVKGQHCALILDPMELILENLSTTH